MIPTPMMPHTYRGVAESRVQVDYVPASKDTFTSTPSTSFTFSITNADVNPDGDGFPNAVLLIAAHLTWNTGTWASPNFAMSIDGNPMTVLAVTDNTNRRHQQLAMIRIPPGGFTSPVVTVTSAALPGATRTFRASANAMYNVNDSSLAFGDGSVAMSLVNDTSADPLDVPSFGAVFVANIQLNGGDFPATVYSQSDEVAYTMQSPQVSVNGPRYMTGYRLFAAGKTGEILLPLLGSGLQLATVVAVALKGAPA